MSAPVFMWFRRDLRLQDNLALEAALRSGQPVIPLFIFDPAILGSQWTGVPRLAFMLKGLQALNESLAPYRTHLWVEDGDPREVLPRLVQQWGATALYYNRDYSPFARRRDAEIETLLDISVHGFDDAVLHTPGTVVKADGKPYTVFTPFKKQLLTLDKRPLVEGYLDKGHFAKTKSAPLPALHDLGFAEPNTPLPPVGEAAAHARLQAFTDNAIFDYGEGRNRLVAQPWTDTRVGSSYLSPYLRFGMLSPRQVYWQAHEVYPLAQHQAARESVETFVSELIWREFYMHILYHFPHVMGGSFRSEYDRLVWDNNPAHFAAWQVGQTGYPVIDAAMRQLQAIGWMPNRARMIVASFLTKDLLIDWRWGETHFMQWLIDGDPAANNGGWQWSAGTGTDAQPYFRIFNPVSQSQKFDPDGEYIRHWVPELRGVPDRYIHSPWQMTPPPADYPPPIVDHAAARARTLAAYQAIK
ncbi:MAG: deoxyribodipyrimidine photo-lyase [Anaerolineales bacterium]|nr:deoxyribodipyrimidine photo-lyase [Anaerolineales bacterium]